MKTKMIVLMCMLASLSGCKAELQPQGASNPVATSIEAPEGNLVLDGIKKTQHSISASEGGFISISSEEGRFDIVFLQGSIENDSTFEVSPIMRISESNKEYFSTGFYLSEKETGEGVTLKAPASICFTTDKQIPENTMIVKYNEKGDGYTVIPTWQISISGTRGLIAMVEGFSGYGIRTVTQGEIDSMADELVKKGFDWVLTSDDEYTQVIPGIDGGQVTLTGHLNMEMTNSQGTDAWLMQGAYSGAASLIAGIDIFVEGESFFSDFNGETVEASLMLYPVPKVYPSINGGPELVGLVPEYYIGSGTLKFQWAHTQPGKAGTDIFDMGMMFGMSGELSEQLVSFSVITSGPFAKITLLDFNSMGPMIYDGMIVGHGKSITATQPELKPGPKLEALDISERYHEDMLKMAQAKANPDGGVSMDKDGDGKYILTVTPGDDGVFYYDLNGDGERDLELAPLVVKK